MFTQVDPFYDAGMRGWLYNTAKANYWRVAEWYELTDLISDGILCYYKCYRAYPFLTIKLHPSQDDKRRFMALVRSAFINHITTLAQKRTAVHERPFSQSMAAEESEEAYLNSLLPAQPEEANFAVMLSNAPAEIKQLMQLLLGDGVAGFDYLRTRLRKVQLPTGPRIKLGRRRLRETTNAYYCRQLGLDPDKVDLPSMVRSYFEGASSPSYV